MTTFKKLPQNEIIINGLNTMVPQSPEFGGKMKLNTVKKTPISTKHKVVIPIIFFEILRWLDVKAQYI